MKGKSTIFQFAVTFFSLRLLVSSNQSSCPGNNCVNLILVHDDNAINHVLEGHVLRRVSLKAGMDCLLMCLADCRCLSINLKSDNSECDLNMENKVTSPGALVSRIGYSYYQIKLKEEQFKQECTASCDNYCCDGPACQNGGTCTQTCDHQYRRLNCTCPQGFTGSLCQTELLVEKPGGYDMVFNTSHPKSYASVRKTVSIGNLSFCLRLKPLQNPEAKHMSLMSLRTSPADNQTIFIWLSEDTRHVMLGIDSYFSNWIELQQFSDGNYHYLCLTYDIKEKKWAFYQDNARLDYGTNDKDQLSLRLQGELSVVLGKFQGKRTGEIGEQQLSLYAQVAEFTLWDRLLTVENITLLAQGCSQSVEGALVRWKEFSTIGEIEVKSPSESCIKS